MRKTKKTPHITSDNLYLNVKRLYYKGLKGFSDILSDILLILSEIAREPL